MNTVTDIPALGTRRRIQALASLGWSLPTVAQLAGLHRATVNRILERPTLSPTTAAAIAGVYRELENLRPVPANRAERISVTKTLEWARASRWRPPAAWDDIDMDDRPAPMYAREKTIVDELALTLVVVDGHILPLNKAETVEAIRRLNERGLTDAEIAERLGKKHDAITKARERHNLPENYNRRFAAERAALGALAS